MNIMQSMRDGYRVDWGKVVAWTWLLVVVGTVSIVFWLIGGWRPFAAMAGVLAAALTTSWAVMKIRDR